jgi:hypothetical protein
VIASVADTPYGALVLAQESSMMLPALSGESTGLDQSTNQQHYARRYTRSMDSQRLSDFNWT